MTVTTIRNLAQNASKVLREVQDTGRPVLVTNNGAVVAAIVPINTEALTEAMEDVVLATAPDSVASMREADEDVKVGRTVSLDATLAALEKEDRANLEAARRMQPKPHPMVGEVTVLPNGNRVTVIGVEPDGDEVVRIDPPVVPDLLEELSVTFDSPEAPTTGLMAGKRRRSSRAPGGRKGQRWTGYAWVDE